ncbi:metallophosphoesterase [Rhodovulum sp. DZ06]|uniref:metallophosphoesterase n=1 Tax=Rhodovulum sp. DZ06 TaxID=3425126 RepID=UPI003D354C4B
MRIIQVTDSHVVPEGRLWKQRVDTAATLARAVSRINTLGADLVVHTGDLCDGGDAASTARAATILAGLRAPLRLVPGNHDRRALLRAHFPGAGFAAGGAGEARLDWTHDAEGLRIIGLDTIIPGATGGRLDDDGAAFLEGALAGPGGAGGPSLLFCHHPPCAMGLPFMDAWPFEGAARAEAILSAAPPLRVACGHVHADVDRTLAGTVIGACPPLSPQIPHDAAPDRALGFLLEAPALRIFDWDADLGLRVRTMPVDHGPGPFFWFDPTAG